MNKNVIRKICLSAVLIVLDILLTSLPRLFEIGPLFSFNRITLGPATVIFASLTVGPFFGGVVGGAADFISWIVLPNSGQPLNIFITLLYTCLGVLPYFLKQFLKKFKFTKDLISILLLPFNAAILISLLFLTNLFDESFLNWGWNLLTAKIIVSAISISLTIISVVLLILLRKKYSHLKIGDLIIICTICEVILMILGKPLCFVLYSNLFYGESLLSFFGVNYFTLVLLAFMFASVMIPLNSFAVSMFLNLNKNYFNGDDNNG